MQFILALVALVLASLPTFAQDAPQFRPEPFWPKPLPENWILGQVSGIAVDKDDHIWIMHRPKTLLDDEKGAMASPPTTKCCKPAPAVMKFDADGNLLASWGPVSDHWVKNEHGIHIDAAGNVWLGGNNDGDQILQFTPDGKFLQQIGKDDGSRGSNSTTRLGRPAHMFTDDAANEIYVADGYGNRRVIVFDMKTGAGSGTGAPTAPRRRSTTSSRPTTRRRSRRRASAIRCIACGCRTTAWFMSATAPTIASRSSARMGRS